MPKENVDGGTLSSFLRGSPASVFSSLRWWKLRADQVLGDEQLFHFGCVQMKAIKSWSAWSMHVHKQPFYWHKETRESRWDLPA